MGLDAGVYCDCFERGRLRSAPPPGCTLSVAPDGMLLSGSDNLDVQLAFDSWRHSEACEHEDGYLVTHWIGNIALVAALRAELGKCPERFPLILKRVIYNGIHAGDMIPAAEVPGLVPEVEELANFHCREPEVEQLTRRFEAQMRELLAASLGMGKPIVF